jgi:hypothetical protein
MSKTEDKILAREIGKLGGPGGNLAARWLPNNVLELTLETSNSPEKALQTAFTVLRQAGRIIEDRRGDTKEPKVWAVVGSGFWNMNPALVKVRVVSAAEGMTQLAISGTAKEGLIKQHAGDKAAKRIANLLSQVLP